MGIHDRYVESRTLSQAFGVGVFSVCLWLGLGVIPAVAEGEASQEGSVATSGETSAFSIDHLKDQITNLDSQIQKLREQSLALQEKTREKLQSQLDILKQQQDALLPRIEIFRDDSERAWLDIKENIQKAIEDLKASVEAMDQ